MILPATRTESVACFRFESPPGSGRFLGCGKGWTQPAADRSGPGYPIRLCPDCGRQTFVTGSFLVAELPR